MANVLSGFGFEDLKKQKVKCIIFSQRYDKSQYYQPYPPLCAFSPNIHVNKSQPDLIALILIITIWRECF